MSRRSVAAYLADSTCPRCGAGRASDQRYCVECGLRLPSATGGLAAWRRGWMRTFGWYPGDWVWLALLAAGVAAAGSAAAVHLGHKKVTASAASTFVAPAPRLTAPAAARGRKGHTAWPPGLDAWTVVVVSSPVEKGRETAQHVAGRAAVGARPEGCVVSPRSFSTLLPGYFGACCGVYGASDDAQAALQTVRARGFRSAYVMRVAP
jgi:hypothetical protein